MRNVVARAVVSLEANASTPAVGKAASSGGVPTPVEGNSAKASDASTLADGTQGAQAGPGYQWGIVMYAQTI